MSHKKNLITLDQLQTPVSPAEAAAAFESTRHLRDAYPASLRSKNLQPVKAAGLVLSTVPRIFEVAPEESGEVAGFDRAHVAELRPIAAAVLHAHAACHTPKDAARANLALEASRLKEKLLPLVDALPPWGVLTLEDVLALPRGRGDLGAATTLVRIAELLKAKWDVVKVKTPVTEADRLEAARVGLELTQLVARRADLEADRRTEVEQDLVRAMAVLVDRYGETQECVRFVRRKEKDAAKIAPSLYPRRRRVKADAVPAEEPAAQPAATPVTPATPVAPAATPHQD